MKRFLLLSTIVLLTSTVFGQEKASFQSDIKVKLLTISSLEKGKSKINLGDYIGAIKDLNEVIGEYRESSLLGEAYYYRGNAKHSLQDYRGAIADYTMAIKDPDFFTFHSFINDRGERVKLGHDFLDAFGNRGSAKLGIGDYVGAITDCDTAIMMRPKNAWAYYIRGISKILLRKKDSGCLDLSKAGELGYEEAYDAIKEYCQ